MTQKNIKIFGIWLCAAFFYAYQYVLRVMPNVLKESIYDTFCFNDVTYGQFAGFWYIGYALSHIPFGILLDRYSIKKILPLSILLCVAGMLPLVQGENWIMPVLGRFLLGIGSTGATLGMFKIIRLYIDHQYFTRVLSFTCIIGVLGAIFGSYPVYVLLKIVDWKDVVYIICLVGVVLAFASYFLLDNHVYAQQMSVWKMLKKLLSDKSLWVISLGAGLFAGPLEGFADAWSMESLVVIYQVSRDVASQATSLIFMGFIVGLLFISYCIDWIGSLKTTIVCGILMFASFLWLLSGTVPAYLLTANLIVLGAFSAYQVSAIYAAINLYSHEYTGLITAFFNMIMMIFGALFHTIIGSCIYQFGLHAPMIDGVCRYQETVYQKGLIVIPIMILIGIMLFCYQLYKGKFYKDAEIS